MLRQPLGGGIYSMMVRSCNEGTFVLTIILFGHNNSLF
jgi:hypothetical protein